MLDSYTCPAIEFFDIFLKGLAPPDSLPRVRWKLGHEGWRTAATWPLPEATTAELYLSDPAAAAGTVPGGKLARRPGDTSEATEWRYDPDDLVPSAAADTFLQLRDHVDERRTLDRDDVLVFTSAASDQPLDLAGPVHAVLYVESAAPTFDIFVRLLDLAPDGTVRLIVRGCAQADRPGEVGIALGHTGYRVRPGHRLALMIMRQRLPEPPAQLRLPGESVADDRPQGESAEAPDRRRSPLPPVSDRPARKRRIAPAPRRAHAPSATTPQHDSGKWRRSVPPGPRTGP